MATGLACSEVLSDLAKADTTRCLALRVERTLVLLPLGKINSKTNSYEASVSQGSYVEVKVGGLAFGARYMYPPRTRGGRVV